MNTRKLQSCAPIVLRVGLVVLFLWFGLSQVTNPAAWIAWVPEWTSRLPIGAQQIVLLNGIFEVILGLGLAVGFWTRAAAALLALHLFFLAFEIGYNDIGVRDFALALATLSIALAQPDSLTLDVRRR